MRGRVHSALLGILIGIVFTVQLFGVLGFNGARVEAAAPSPPPVYGPEVAPCGDGGFGFNIGRAISGGLCGFVVLFRKMTLSLLLTGTQLLATQAQYLRDTDNSTGSVIDGVKSDSRDGAITPLLDLNSLDDDIELPIQTVLLDARPDKFGYVVRIAYNRILGALNVFLIIILIIVALTNILQVQLNTFSLKKVLPGLLVGFLAAQGSFFITRAALEVADQIGTGIISVGSRDFTFTKFMELFSSFPFDRGKIVVGATNGKKCLYQPDNYYLTKNCEKTGDIDDAKVTRLFMTSILTILPAVILFVLGFLLVLRRFVFFFLVPLAPLAFMSQGFQPASFIWGKWSKLFYSWLFMPVVAGFWIWLALTWINSGTNGNAAIPGILTYIFGVGCLWLAVKTPFSMAGQAEFALKKWSQLGKAGVNVGKVAAVGGATALGGAAFNALGNHTPFGTAYRGFQGVRTNLKEYAKSRSEDWKTGAVSRGEVDRRNALKDEINKLLEKRKKAQDADPATTKKKKSQQKIDRLSDEIARLEAADPIINAAKIAKKRSLIDSAKVSIKKQDIQLAKVGEKAVPQADIDKLTARLDRPQGFFGALERATIQGRIKRETRKNYYAAAQSENEGLARQDILNNPSAGFFGQSNQQFIEMQARLEVMKESAGVLDQITKDRIKSEKNNLQATDAYFTELRRRKIDAHSDAETSETDRELKYLDNIKSDSKLLQKMLTANMQSEARKKEEDKVLNKQASLQVREYGTLDRVTDKVKEGSLADAQKLITEALDPKINSYQDNRGLWLELQKRVNEPNVTSADIKTTIDNYEISQGRDPRTSAVVRRRVESHFNSKVSGERNFIAESKLYQDSLYANRGEGLEAVIRGDGFKLDQETVSAASAFIKELEQGEIYGPQADKVIAVLDEIEKRTRLNVKPETQAALIEFRRTLDNLRHLPITATESERRAAAKPFVSSDEAGLIGLNQRTGNLATRQYSRKDT